MTHPSFEQLTAFANSNEPSSIGEHLDDCERCTTIFEGIKIANIESEKRKISTNQFFEASQQKNKEKIEQIRFQKESSFSSKSLLLKIAATIAIALGIAFYFYSNQFDADVFVSNQISMNRPMPNIERGPKNDFNWTAFTTNFKNSKFQEALSILDDIAVENRNSSFEFFHGLCYLYLEEPNYGESSKSFIQVIESENRFEEQARWYLALSYYKLGDFDALKQILAEIKNTKGHFRTEEAEELLQNI